MSGSTPKLSEAARHVVFPSTIETSLWPRVVARAREMGVEFDQWQHGAGTLALGKRADGKYASTVGGVVLSIPRQVGKTFFVSIVAISLCTLFPGLTVLWTAHRTRTSTNTFDTMQGLVRSPKIAPFLPSTVNRGIRTANGEQEIMFANGSRIMIGARGDGFGRGFDEVDIEVFDEAQILTERVLEDMVAATNQSRFEAGALLFFMGTPPRPVDPGSEFTNRRQKALSGKTDNMVYIEFSADDDADPDDQDQWRKANPSFPHRTPQESMERMREQLTNDESFLREALGVWSKVQRRGVVPMDAWSDRFDESSMAVDRLALGIEVGPDLESASVVLAGQRADGDWHVEIDETRSGAAWLVSYVGKMLDANPQLLGVAGDVGGPLKALTEERGGRWFLKGTQIRVHAPRVVELGAACSHLLDGVVTGWLHHIGQPQLDTAVRVAGKRALGDTGMWVFSRKTAVADITSVQASALGLWLAQNGKASIRAGRSSSGRQAVVL